MERSENPLKVYPQHNRILSQLFGSFPCEKQYVILDAGSGRTSLYFLTENFPESQIDALVYPGDLRKIEKIRRDVRGDNYELIEQDITTFEQEKTYDIVLAHLLLGEAEKFGGNSFGKVLGSLFSIKTTYLVIVDISEDPSVDFNGIQKKIKEGWWLEKKVTVDKYVGYVLKMK